MITILGDFLRKNWRFLKNHCYDFLPTGISDTVPRFCYLQRGCNTATITRHLFPALSLEHLSQSLKSNLALHSLFTLYFRPLVPKSVVLCSLKMSWWVVDLANSRNKAVRLLHKLIRRGHFPLRFNCFLAGLVKGPLWGCCYHRNPRSSARRSMFEKIEIFFQLISTLCILWSEVGFVDPWKIVPLT
jgi:hypothetical protein